MPGILQLAQLARLAEARMRTARELQARWRELDPDQQREARDEATRLGRALVDVRERVAAGPKGFARGFRAGLRGEDAPEVEDPRPLTELVRELHGASQALRAKLDAVDDREAVPGPERPGPAPD